MMSHCTYYQIITDKLLDQLVKNKLAAVTADKDADERHDECLEPPLLTFEEENAIRYVGNYVCNQKIEGTAKLCQV